MSNPLRTIEVPKSYATPPDRPILISNHPSRAEGVTPIQVVTLNRPEKLNAFSIEMINALEDFFTTVDVDDRVKVIVLTGAGRAFSAGIDLSSDATAGKSQPTRDLRDPGGTLALAMYNSSKTIIVAYNGLSVGIGMTSTLAAAIRIASVKSEFGFPFARIGLTMESSSSFFLPRMVGYSNATYLLTTGRRFKANHSTLQGIFAELLPEPEDVLPRALEIAKDVLENVGTMAAHLNRQLIWRNPGSAEGAHLVDSPVLFDMFGSKDHLEFKKSFFEKRKANFTDVLSKDAPRTYPWWTEVSVATRPKIQDRAEPKL
ncbi:hypothetical protein LTR84_011591 [Exophiala bonariae]|uniref:Enoyl-CoA hydratase n=1 Tax=Exophiala bonariae TaxID=1690606 RepID=A0AAV9NIV6_9EURO|nr:hypothetical protein LTR84_011591 [Exophiala bonariae]